MLGRLSVALIVTALVGGCGYRLVGAGAVSAPSSTLWVGPVPDDSDEPLFGAHVRTALAREVVDRADAALADREHASARLTVHVVSTKETTSAFVAGDKARQYLLVAVAEATLTSRDGKVLWRDSKLQVERQFAAGTTVEETELNKQRALNLLSGDVAREIMRRVSLTLTTLPSQE